MRTGGTIAAPLGRRDFRLLLGGQLVSNVGDWLDFVALAVLIVYVWHKGAGSLAALTLVVALPWIVVAPASGVLVDRWPKKRVMVGSDLLRAATVLAYMVAPNLLVLLALVGLKMVVSTFFTPAEQTTIRAVVPDEQLYAANSLAQLVAQSTKVLGPALGGVLVGFSGPHTAFAIDAASFLASAAILSRLRPVEPAAAPAVEGEGAEPPGGTFWRELREGLAYIASRRALLVGMVTFTVATFLLLAFDSLSPLAFRELGVGRALFGVAIGGIGLGGVVGAIAVGRYAAAVNPFVLMGGGSAVVGSLVAVMGVVLLSDVHVHPFLWTPLLFGVGVASAGILIASPTILQRETPLGLLGRVNTSAGVLPTVGQIFAPIVGATVAAWQSVGFVFATAGLGLASVGAVVLAVRPPVGLRVEEPEAGRLQPPVELAGELPAALAEQPTKGATA